MMMMMVMTMMMIMVMMMMMMMIMGNYLTMQAILKHLHPRKGFDIDQWKITLNIND